MARHHNTQHPNRGRSSYPLKLKSHGLSSHSVQMESVEVLRRRQLTPAERGLAEAMDLTAPGDRPPNRGHRP